MAVSVETEDRSTGDTFVSVCGVEMVVYDLENLRWVLAS